MSNLSKAAPLSSSSSIGSRTAGRLLSAWSLCLGILATPMLLDALFRPFALGPDSGVARAGIVLVEATVVMVWLISARTIRFPQRPHTFVLVMLGGWIVASIVATIAADWTVPALLRSAEWAGHGLFAFVLWNEFQKGDGRLKQAQQAIAVGLVLLTLLVGVYALALPNAGGHNWLHHIPFLGIRGHARYFGIYALAGFTFAARALLDSEATQRSRGWAVSGMTLGWAVMFWTGGRASVGAGFVVAAALWGMAGGQRRRFAMGLLCAVVAGALISLCFPVDNGGLGLWRIIGLGSIGNASTFTSGRTELWATALAAWKQQPWFGIGPGASAYVLSALGSVQPHNFVVQALVEWGVLGTVPFLVLLSLLLHKAVRSALAERRGAHRAERAVAAAYLLGATANAMLDGLFYDSRGLLILAAATAMVLQPASSSKGRAFLLRAWTKSYVAVGTSGIVLLFVLHLGVVRALWLPRTPPPDSPRVALLMAFPSPSHLRVTADWVQEWKSEHPVEALELAQWGSRYAHLSWFHIRREADLLHEQGHRERALDRYAEADRRESEAKRFVRR